jgi:hypothetical protein
VKHEPKDLRIQFEDMFVTIPASPHHITRRLPALIEYLKRRRRFCPPELLSLNMQEQLLLPPIKKHELTKEDGSKDNSGQLPSADGCGENTTH